jgi:hypothetical protein
MPSPARGHITTTMPAEAAAPGGGGGGAATAPAPLLPPATDAAAPAYREPSLAILAAVDSPPEPGLSFSPDRSRVLQLHRPPPLPPVADLARPELKLGGLRIDPELNARSRMSHYTRLTIAEFGPDTVLPVRDGRGETTVTVRGGGRACAPFFSFFFLRTPMPTFLPFAHLPRRVPKNVKQIHRATRPVCC